MLCINLPFVLSRAHCNHLHCLRCTRACWARPGSNPTRGSKEHPHPWRAGTSSLVPLLTRSSGVQSEIRYCLSFFIALVISFPSLSLVYEGKLQSSDRKTPPFQTINGQREKLLRLPQDLPLSNCKSKKKKRWFFFFYQVFVPLQKIASFFGPVC